MTSPIITEAVRALVDRRDLTRITVQGGTTKPREWLRLTIDPRSPQVFSWENVYCDDTTCPQ